MRVCVRTRLGAQVCVPVLLRPRHGLLKSPAREKELVESNLRGAYETLTSAEFSKTFLDDYSNKDWSPGAHCPFSGAQWL